MVPEGLIRKIVYQCWECKDACRIVSFYRANALTPKTCPFSEGRVANWKEVITFIDEDSIPDDRNFGRPIENAGEVED